MPGLGRPGAGPSHPFVYLASQSPRRAQLLDQLGVRHVFLLADGDEDAEALEAERRGEMPAAYVERVTRAKLAAARRRLAARALPVAPILCADTTVVLGRRILGKPRDAEDARRMLASLSGRTHRVLTAVAVWTGRRRLESLNVSRVHFAPLPPPAIEAYVAGGEPSARLRGMALRPFASARREGCSGFPQTISSGVESGLVQLRLAGSDEPM